MGSNNLPVLASWVAEPEEGLCGLGWILGCHSEKQLSHKGARNWMKVLSHLSSPLCISYKKISSWIIVFLIFRSLIIVLIPYHRSLSLSRPQQVRWLTFYDRVLLKDTNGISNQSEKCNFLLWFGFDFSSCLIPSLSPLFFIFQPFSFCPLRWALIW